MKTIRPVKIHVLNDNVAGRWCRAEHGLSFLVEADETILFDTGSSDLIGYNARIMQKNLEAVKAIVLSHGHDDHSGGLMLLPGRQLICHPDVFLKRIRKSNHTPLGIRWDEPEIRRNFEVVATKEPFKISEQIWFLGEIPRLNSFESQTTAFVKEDGTEDFVMDDSGLAIPTAKGLVVISGCAHSGICNMTAHAKSVTGIEKVHAVVGGFHLQNDDKLTKKTIDWLKESGVEQVIPSHCTALPAQMAISREYKFVQVKSGNTIELG